MGEPTPQAVDDARDEHQNTEKKVARRERKGDPHWDESADHPKKLLAHGETRERPTLCTGWDVTLGYCVKAWLGHCGARAEPTREKYLGDERGM